MERVGSRPLQPMPAAGPLDAAALSLRHQIANPGALSPAQRLHLANRLALGEVAESAKHAITHPGKAISDTVKGLGQLLTRPGEMIGVAKQTWQHDRQEGAILSGRLLSGYVGAAGLFIGSSALLGRMGAGALGMSNLAFAIQQGGKHAFQAARIAGATGIGLDVGALTLHQVAAARATTSQELGTAVNGLHGDLTALVANGATTGLSHVGGAGMKVLATHLREQELAGSLGATNRAVFMARKSQVSLSATEMTRAKLSGSGSAATLTEELKTIVGRKVSHLSAGERVQLAEYLNQSLSQAEQAAAGKAIAAKLQPGTSVDDLIAIGERAAWEASGISAETLQALKRKGWSGNDLQGVREAVRGTGLREGQQAGALQQSAERLLKAEKHTGSNTRRLQNAIVRESVVDSLKEIGVTRSVDRIAVADLQHLDTNLNTADPRSRAKMVALLNESGSKFSLTTFWRAAYETLYADLGVDPAVFRALAPAEVTFSGVTALERVYSQLKMLPPASRQRVSQAIAAVELKPSDASRVMKQAHVTEMTASIRAALPAGEKAKAGAITEALVKELLDGEAVRTRGLIASQTKELPGQLLRGNVKALPAFVRSVGKSKAQTESLIAGVSSAINKLPPKTAQQVFRNLSQDRSVGAQLTNRLTKVLTEDFGVTVKRSQVKPMVHWELKVADMDAAGALHLYNALEAMSGPQKTLPKLAKAGVFTRTDTQKFSGVALDGDDGHKYTALTDLGLVDDAWSDAAGTSKGEGIWVHEIGHQMQATGITAAEKARTATWAKLGQWQHANGKAADGTHPYKRTNNDIYKDPTVSGNTKETVSGYAKTDPAEDWAEFVRIGTADPVTALQVSPPKFLYFATQMAPGWGNRLKQWATEAGVDLAAARTEAAERLGHQHPALKRIDTLLAGLPE
jgi:hypothetical protein